MNAETNRAHSEERVVIVWFICEASACCATPAKSMKELQFHVPETGRALPMGTPVKPPTGDLSQIQNALIGRSVFESINSGHKSQFSRLYR